MKKAVLFRALLFCAACSLLLRPAGAHRLDEYLQATLIDVEPGAVSLTMRLVPGVAVAPAVVDSIDTNRDGVFSPAEQRRYADRLMTEVLLQEDGRTLPRRLVRLTFPEPAAMWAGTGQIELAFTAPVQTGGGRHRLIWENHHFPAMSVYLVNALVPQAESLRIESQTCNRNQLSYEIFFVQRPAGATSSSGPSLSGFAAAWWRGVHHIAQGTDHCCFC